jgi:hypothetical protein
MVHSAGSDFMLWSAEQDGCIAVEKKYSFMDFPIHKIMYKISDLIRNSVTHNEDQLGGEN